MAENINKDCENQRKQKLENSNSEEVKVFQRNNEIWHDEKGCGYNERLANKEELT